MKERGYTYTDVIHCCPEKLPEYEKKILTFYEEHIHYDEEIRYCMEGSGYFDGDLNLSSLSSFDRVTSL